MHDLLIALAFIGMVVAPAIVAATTDVDFSKKIRVACTLRPRTAALRFTISSCFRRR